MDEQPHHAGHQNSVLYIGIADAQVPGQPLDLGRGVTLSAAGSRLMRPFILTPGLGEP